MGKARGAGADGGTIGMAFWLTKNVVHRPAGLLTMTRKAGMRWCWLYNNWLRADILIGTDSEKRKMKSTWVAREIRLHLNHDLDREQFNCFETFKLTLKIPKGGHSGGENPRWRR